MSFWTGLKNTGKDIFDPGWRDRERAEGVMREALAGWDSPAGNVEPWRDQLLMRDAYGFARTPDLLESYSTGAPLSVTDEQRIQNMIGRGDSAWNGFQADPTGRTGQLMTAQYLGNIAAGGTDAVADADYERRRQQAEQLAQGQRDAAVQAAEMRGGGAGGAELLADITGGQSAAQSANMAGIQAAADAQQRRDAAARAAGDLSGAIRSGDFQEAAAQNDARDAWSQWWGEAQRDVDAYNADREARANFYNWQRTNDVNDRNTDQWNQAYQYNSGRWDRQFDRWLAMQQGRSNAASGVASNLQTNAASTPSAWNTAKDVGATVGKMIAGAQAGGFI